MKKIIKSLLVLSLGVLTLYACKKSSSTNTTEKTKEVAVKADPCEGATFSAVNTIISERCVKCHTGAKAKAGFDLTKAVTIKALAKSNKLLCVIKGESCKKMPPIGGRLKEDQIAMIDCWIKAGMLD